MSSQSSTFSTNLTALTRVKSFTLPRFLRLRLPTLLRRMLGRLGVMEPSLQLIFLHIPKAAGTTAKDYMIACVGSRKRGQAVFLTEYFPDDLVSEDEFRLARRAQFVSGHFSWSSLERLPLDRSLTFTTLCDPAERLWSVYFNLRMTAHTNRRKGMAEMYKWACELDAAEFYALGDWRIHHLSDNAMVRQLAGNFDTLPSNESEWRACLEKAKQNLLRLDRICFKSTFDQDFVKVLKAARFPVVEPIGRQNVTSDPKLSGGNKNELRALFIKQSSDLIEPLVRWDRELYEFALDLRASGKI